MVWFRSQERTRAPDQHAFVIASDGTWFKPPGAEVVSLAARPALSGLVRELSRGHSAAPGSVVMREDLVRAIWPDERSSRRSLGNRRSVALSTLRTLGLKAIVATPRGASFEPSVPVECERRLQVARPTRRRASKLRCGS